MDGGGGGRCPTDPSRTWRVARRAVKSVANCARSPLASSCQDQCPMCYHPWPKRPSEAMRVMRRRPGIPAYLSVATRPE